MPPLFFVKVSKKAFLDVLRAIRINDADQVNLHIGVDGMMSLYTFDMDAKRQTYAELKPLFFNTFIHGTRCSDEKTKSMFSFGLPMKELVELASSTSPASDSELEISIPMDEEDQIIVFRSGTVVSKYCGYKKLIRLPSRLERFDRKFVIVDARDVNTVGSLGVYIKDGVVSLEKSNEKKQLETCVMTTNAKKDAFVVPAAAIRQLLNDQPDASFVSIDTTSEALSSIFALDKHGNVLDVIPLNMVASACSIEKIILADCEKHYSGNEIVAIAKALPLCSTVSFILDDKDKERTVNCNLSSGRGRITFVFYDENPSLPRERNYRNVSVDPYF